MWGMILKRTGSEFTVVCRRPRPPTRPRATRFVRSSDQIYPLGRLY